MDFTLPTLDELEAWWLAHPDATAEPGMPEACVIAVPLADRFGYAEIDPGDVLESTRVTVYTRDIDKIAGAPLTRELNTLAIEFDAVVPAFDGYVCAETCVELIRDIKAKIAREAA